MNTKITGKGEPTEGDGCEDRERIMSDGNDDDEQQHRILLAVAVFEDLLRWIGTNPFHARITQTKVIAALLVLSPSALSARSVAQVAKRLGTRRQTLDAVCARLRALLPVAVSGQRSPAQREHLANGQRLRHARKVSVYLRKREKTKGKK